MGEWVLATHGPEFNLGTLGTLGGHWILQPSSFVRNGAEPWYRWGSDSGHRLPQSCPSQAVIFMRGQPLGCP